MSAKRAIVGAAAAVAGLAVGLMLFSPSRGTAEEGDKGPRDALRDGLVVLREQVDGEAGIDWQLVTYDSPSGICVDVWGTSSTGEPLGGPGGCGIGDPFVERLVAEAADVLPAWALVDPPIVQILAAGELKAAGLEVGEKRFALVGGVATCNCRIAVNWSDGVETTADVVAGFFVATREVAPVTEEAPEALQHTIDSIEVLP